MARNFKLVMDRWGCGEVKPSGVRVVVLFLLTSSCFYPRQDDAEKDGETERCLPVYGACSMNDEVPKQSHDDGNNQTYSKHGYKINEYFLDVHFSSSLVITNTPRCMFIIENDRLTILQAK